MIITERLNNSFKGVWRDPGLRSCTWCIVPSLNSMLVDTFLFLYGSTSWLCSEYVRKEHSYFPNTSKQTTMTFNWLTFSLSLEYCFWNILKQTYFYSDGTMRSHLYQSINSVMVVFLHCTSMLTIVESIRKVLFALHLYSPAWALVILLMFNRFPSMISPVFVFLQITVGSCVKPCDC